MMTNKRFGLAAGLVSMALVGCGAPEDFRAGAEPGGAPHDIDGKADTSAVATLLDFAWDGKVVMTSSTGAESTIRDHLLYTIGHLNGNNSVGRLDRLVISNITSTRLADGKYEVSYKGKMPVAWGSKSNLPTSYAFKLPRLAGYAGYEAFTTKYKASCVDYGAHDVDSGSMWYYYRPNKSGCALAETDIVKFTATATVSSVNTTGKYPEYHKVWEDNLLKVVAIFGKYEDGATTSSDAGIAAYQEFIASTKSALSAFSPTTSPATLPSSPGVSTPEISFSATLPNGKKVEVFALLVDNVRTAGATFDARYAQLSTKADLIGYNGHAGLGANVRALAQKGTWTAGQYVIFYINGCDTFAYVDGSLAQTRASINSDDPNGTKYMEFVINAMPAFFTNMADGTMAFLNALLKPESPKTYEQVIGTIDSSHVVVVTGEQDNVYYPGMGGGSTGGTTGGGGGALLDEAGSVVQNEALQYNVSVGAGRYEVVMNGDNDADLYVRKNAAPTTSLYDCRPYADGSSERCTIDMAAAGKIYISVMGYAARSNFTLKVTGGPAPAGSWAGIDESGTVVKDQEKRWQTPSLPAGTYSFVMTGSGGDADLYVKTGTAPTTSSYSCRPYLNGSNESCAVTLSAPGVVHVMVRGWAASSTFRLVGRAGQ